MRQMRFRVIESRRKRRQGGERGREEEGGKEGGMEREGPAQLNRCAHAPRGARTDALA